MDLNDLDGTLKLSLNGYLEDHVDRIRRLKVEMLELGFAAAACVASFLEYITSLEKLEFVSFPLMKNDTARDVLDERESVARPVAEWLLRAACSNRSGLPKFHTLSCRTIILDMNGPLGDFVKRVKPTLRVLGLGAKDEDEDEDPDLISGKLSSEFVQLCFYCRNVTELTGILSLSEKFVKVAVRAGVDAYQARDLVRCPWARSHAASTRV